MGYKFTPDKDNNAALHGAADKLEKLLEEFIKSLKNCKGVKLLVKAPHWTDKSAGDPLDDDWYSIFPTLVKECELKLQVYLKGGLLRSDKVKTYARVKLTRLPACCGVCVMNSMELHPDIRGNGIGKEFTRVAEAFARVLNYSYVMCTTHKVNGPAIGVLDCLGYTRHDGFANMRTKNSVEIYGKNINPEGKALTDGYLDPKDGK